VHRLGFLAVTAVATAAAAAAPAAAQTIDFRTTNGGFTSQSITGANPWSYVAGTGWQVNGAASVARQRLLSPVLTAAGGAFAVDALHAFNFEQNILTTGCFDGGAVFASINGGSFVQLAPTAGRPYTGPVSATFSNPLAGLQAFCGNSNGLVSSVFSGAAPAGTTIQLAIDGGWDNSFANSNPNWAFQQVTISGFGAPQQVIPEPSTYALLGAGLATLGAAARRRRAG
jgi:hypothetical protein